MAKIGFHKGSQDDLKHALKELCSRLAFVLLERIDVIAFDRYDFDDATSRFQLTDSNITDIELAAWDEGRAFGEIVELRWRKTEDGQYHSCCLSADDSLPSQINANTVIALTPADWECHSLQFYLWGEKTEGKTDEWIEQRIPRFLCYPIAVADPQKKTRILLKAEEYIRRDLKDCIYNVEERFMRFKRLCEASEGGQF